MPPGKTERHPGFGVAILAKAPLAGFAKTRLIPHLGAEGAASLQRWLLQRTVTTALSAGIGPVTLWCAPDTCAEPSGRSRCTGSRMAISAIECWRPLPKRPRPPEPW